MEFVGGGELSLEVRQAVAALFSLEKARAGDMSQIAERLSLGKASDREVQFIVDYLRGKVKTRKRRRGDLTILKKAMIHQFIVSLTAKNVKIESVVKEA